MAEQNQDKEIKENEETENEGAEIYTLTDETGKEMEFEKIGELTESGKVYYAMIPLDEVENDEAEYVILQRVNNVDGDDDFVTIDDDAEFDKIADLFDELFSEVDYDGEE